MRWASALERRESEVVMSREGVGGGSLVVAEVMTREVWGDRRRALVRFGSARRVMDFGLGVAVVGF